MAVCFLRGEIGGSGQLVGNGQRAVWQWARGKNGRERGKEFGGGGKGEVE